MQKGATMKKKNLLLALLSSSLILASCGDDKAEDKGSNETSQTGDSNATSDPVGTSEPEVSVDTRTNEQKVKELFALMAEDKSTTFEYEGCKTEYFGDTKGIWTVVPANDQGYTNSGTAVIPNYGIYSVAFDDEADEMYLSEILSPNTSLKISDTTYTTKDLGTAAAAITWTESSRTHTFNTTDETFCGALMGMLGLGSYVPYYGSKKASFQVNDAGTALINLTLDISNPTTTELKAIKVDGMKISNVGSTMNLDFEVVFTNPSITTKTAWNQYELAYMTTYLHPQFTLPFPTGATYAVNVTALEDGSFYFEDFGCGNIVNSYKSQLEAAGFTVNDEQTNALTGTYCYEKTLAAATSTTYAIKEYVRFAWDNDSSKALYYPNGAFMIIAYPAYDIPKITAAQLTSTLRSHTLHDGTPYWPDVSLGNCTGAQLQDGTAEMTAQYPSYPSEFYGMIKLYYATEADALDAYQTIIGQLTKNGYTLSSGKYVITDYYEEDYYSYVVERVEITVQVAYDESGNYLGYIQLIIDSYTYEAY
jgi:hypothetical protein